MLSDFCFPEYVTLCIDLLIYTYQFATYLAKCLLHYLTGKFHDLQVKKWFKHIPIVCVYWAHLLWCIKCLHSNPIISVGCFIVELLLFSHSSLCPALQHTPPLALSRTFQTCSWNFTVVGPSPGPPFPQMATRLPSSVPRPLSFSSRLTALPLPLLCFSL